MVDDLRGILTKRKILLFPVWQSMALEVISHHDDVTNQRLEVLEDLIKGGAPVVVAPIEALMRRLVPADIYRRGRVQIEIGQQLHLEELQHFFVQHGYQRVELITAPGQFSIRGGIIDVYPITAPNPIRVELWDDEVDSMRTFDLTTQRSLENIQRAEIPPAREMVLEAQVWAEGRERLLQEYRNHSKKLHRTATVDAQHQLEAQVESWLNRLETPAYYEGIEQLMPYFYPRPSTLLDYLPPGVPGVGRMIRCE